MKISLTNPLDMHVHLRDGEILETVARATGDFFVGAVVMPNLIPPVKNAVMVENYRAQILKNTKNFTPFMTLYAHDALDEKEIIEAKNAGVGAVKLYPKGATTNSDAGVSEILNANFMRTAEILQDLGLILCVHGECGGFCMERENAFLPIFEELARRFPRLKIIIEHMSDARSIRILRDFENIFGTLTFHHLCMDIDDVMGAGANVFHFCKPILKTPRDRDALLELALAADPKICFGSDSAPHLDRQKLSPNAPAGIFSAPFLLERLCTLFRRHGKTENLQAFVSDNAKKIYGFSHEKNRKITLERCETFEISGEFATKYGEKITILRGESDFRIIENVVF